MKKVKDTILKIFNVMGEIVVGVLPVLLAVGMLNVILVLLGPTVFNLLKAEDGTYKLLKMVANAGFYYLPIYIAISSAETFKTNKYLAALVGAMLIHPDFVQMVNDGVSLDFFSLPVTPNNYANQMLPIMVSVYIMSILYKFFNDKINDRIESLVVPVLTLLCMVPITFCIIGPIGLILGNYLIGGLNWIETNCGFFAHGIIAALIPIIVITGLTGAMDSMMVMLVTEQGFDTSIFFSNILYNTALGFVTLAIYLRQKKKDSKLLTACITAIGGVSEPAIFGYLINDRKGLLSLICGQLAGGLVAGWFKVKSFSIASFSVLGILATIGEGSSIVYAAIALIVDCVVAFTLSFILHKTNESSK